MTKSKVETHVAQLRPLNFWQLGFDVTHQNDAPSTTRHRSAQTFDIQPPWLSLYRGWVKII